MTKYAHFQDDSPNPIITPKEQKVLGDRLLEALSDEPQSWRSLRMCFEEKGWEFNRQAVGETLRILQIDGKITINENNPLRTTFHKGGHVKALKPTVSQFYRAPSKATFMTCKSCKDTTMRKSPTQKYCTRCAELIETKKIRRPV